MVEIYEGITYSRKDKIGYIQFDRPPVNAFSPEMGRGLHRILELAEKDSLVRVVVVSGTGEYFSTGMDLKSVDVQNVDIISDLQQNMFNAIAYKLYVYQKPTICELNGTAAGIYLGRRLE